MATNYPGSLDTSTQQPSPSASTEMDDSGFEHDAVHTNHSGAIIALETKVGTGDSNAVANSVLAGTGAGTSAWTTGTLANDISGNAATATALETARTINGTSFNGTANITVTAAAGTLTGGTLNSGVTASSLTSVGTLTSLTTSGDITGTSDTNFFVKNDSGEEILFQESSNSLYFKTNGTYRAYFTSGGDFVPYADNSYDIGSTSLRFHTANIGNTINLDSGLHLTQNDADGAMRIQGNSGYIDIGPKNSTYCHIYTDRGKFYLNKGINSAPHLYWRDNSGIGGPLSDTSSTSGYRYVLQNQTYGTFFDYTSVRDRKDQITNVTAEDSGRWIDALQPVTYIERWLGEGDEPDDARTWREADMQVGFIADDILANSDTDHFSQVLDNGEGGLDPAGWKWECVLAAAVAEIKALRGREATLEARVVALEAA